MDFNGSCFLFLSSETTSAWERDSNKSHLPAPPPAPTTSKPQEATRQKYDGRQHQGDVQGETPPYHTERTPQTTQLL